METLNIELEELTDNVISIIYRDETTGLPIDLTDYHAIMELRLSFGDHNILLSLTDTNGGITLGGPSGNVDIIFTKTQTDQQSVQNAWRRAAYDLIMIDPVGYRRKIMKGFVTLARSASLE